MYELIDLRTEKVLENISRFKGKNTPVDSVKLAKFFGFTVYLNDNMCPSTTAKLNVSLDGKKEIRVNSMYIKDSIRISIAECISYYLLYYEGEGEFSYTGNLDDAEKCEYVSYFARNLLMPKEEFTKTYESLLENEPYSSVISELEILYLVPNDAILNRIQDIACVGKRLVKSCN